MRSRKGQIRRVKISHHYCQTLYKLYTQSDRMYNGKPQPSLNHQAGEGYVATPVQPAKVERPPTIYGIELKWIS